MQQERTRPAGREDEVIPCGAQGVQAIGIGNNGERQIFARHGVRIVSLASEIVSATAPKKSVLDSRHFPKACTTDPQRT
jgi:hypothetical protein